MNILKIKTKENKLVLYSDFSILSFDLFDKKIFRVIEKNIHYLNKEGCLVSIEKKSDKRSYLVLSYTTSDILKEKEQAPSKSIRIIIPEGVAYEISSRMILLNKSLKVPKRTDMQNDRN